MGTLIGIARRDKKRAEMETLDEAHVSMETGVESDFRGRPGRRQVTVLSFDDWRAACDEVGSDLPWTTRRANLLVDGLALPRRPGSIISIGDLRLEVTMETDPCSRMEAACPGLREALQPEWRGGVCCRVIAGGDVRLGDAVSVESTDTGNTSAVV